MMLSARDATVLLLKLCSATMLLSFLAGIAQAQNIEPRRWSHLPLGANFLGVGYAYTDGNIFVDPTLQVEGAQVNVHSLGLAYIRSFGLFGKSARVDFKAPYSNGKWQGIIDNELRSTERSGFGDPSIRFSVNLAGAPALKPADFVKFKARTIIGAGVNIVVPVGKYEAGRIVNLGSNRWVVTPQIGVTRQTGKFATELTGAVWLFGDNDKHLGTRLREQDPFYTIQGHVVYNIRRGMWTSLSAGYGTGGETIIDGVAKDDQLGNFIWAASFGYSINRNHGFKVAFISGTIAKDTGVDFNRIQVGYSYMWGKGL